MREAERGGGGGGDFEKAAAVDPRGLRRLPEIRQVALGTGHREGTPWLLGLPAGPHVDQTLTSLGPPANASRG
jgi:hypothetical protein